MNHLILNTDIKETIKNRLPLQVRSQIASIVEQAYSLALAAITHTTMLNWELGQRHEGYLRNLAVGYLFQQQINMKELPLLCSYEFNRNRSHMYQVLSFNNIKITFNQVAYANQIARPAYFRQKLLSTNQASLYFPDLDGELPAIDTPLYLLLTYSRGGTSPKFVNIGVPQVWRERIDLLKEVRSLPNTQETLEKEEVVTEEALAKFRKFAKEVEDLGGK